MPFVVVINTYNSSIFDIFVSLLEESLEEKMKYEKLMEYLIVQFYCKFAGREEIWTRRIKKHWSPNIHAYPNENGWLIFLKNE